MIQKYTVRYINQNEVPQLINLCAEHAAYEQSEYLPGGKAEALSKGLFSDNPALVCLVVDVENQLKGFLTYMIQYSTWDACEYIYMDCLFLREELRGQGIGKQLMIKLKGEAKRSGIKLIQWQTPDLNEPAIRFYHRIGATSKSKERFFWILDN